MKSILICLSACIICSVLFATEKITKKDLIIQNMGGYIERPNKLTGRIAIVAANKNIDLKQLDTVAKLINRSIHSKVEVKSIDSIDIGAADKVKKDMGLSGVVFVVEGNIIPCPSIVAIESQWAIVNVSYLKDKAKSDIYVNARLRKELIRTFLALFGSFSSKFNGDLLSPIRSVDELDKIANERPPMDVMGKVKNYLTHIGVETRPPTTYLVACREGWAPAPTNEYQKAVWDKIHAMPTAPIKIKPETKKVRE